MISDSNCLVATVKRYSKNSKTTEFQIPACWRSSSPRRPHYFLLQRDVRRSFVRRYSGPGSAEMFSYPKYLSPPTLPTAHGSEAACMQPRRVLSEDVGSHLEKETVEEKAGGREAVHIYCVISPGIHSSITCLCVRVSIQGRISPLHGPAPATWFPSCSSLTLSTPSSLGF